MSDYDEDKFLIFISSVMTWSNTPPKEKVWIYNKNYNLLNNLSIFN